MKTHGIFFLFALSIVACQKMAEENIYGNNDGIEESRSSRITGSEETYYYWYNGERKSLTLDRSRVNVIMKDKGDASLSSSLAQQFEKGQQVSNVVKLNFKSMPATKIEYTQRVKALKLDGQIKHVLPFFERGKDAEPIGTSDIFYVELKKAEDIAVLEDTARQHGVRIVEQAPYMPLWYVLSMMDSDFDNTIDASNYFYETGHFENVDPAFMFDFTPDFVPNDPLFKSDQLWGLNNVSNQNYDINAVAAWDFSQGEGVAIAVVDQGIDPNHNDLSPNFHNLSYDAPSGTSQSVFYPFLDHGTHVAGIAAAVGNNKKNVIGVAPKAKIMRVSHDLFFSSTISYELAMGITWAWLHGADVITNSWGDRDQYGVIHGEMHSTLLEQAVVAAMTQGRGGKGCVVLFAAGNHAVMNYPAKFHEDILTVGSINRNGSRYFTSGYGAELDVVAPGVGIISTIPGNTTGEMTGTSMATPHVAGIAALILSEFPNLTQKQVVKIIESTAKKVGGSYIYSTTSGRPNGPWNEEMGYGLVDAYEAVKSANLTIDGPSSVFTNTPVTYSIPSSLPAGVHFGRWTVSGTNVTYNSYTATNLVAPTTTICFKATCQYTLTATFYMPDGSTYNVTKVVDAANILAGVAITGQDVWNTLDPTTYSIPPTLPTGVTFNGWTVAGGEYTTTGGLANHSLSIKFADKAKYTLTAKFTLPDGTVPTRNKVVNTKYLDELSNSWPDLAILNTTTTYNIPNSLPSGLSFNGWSVSPDSGYVMMSDSTDHSLGIQFAVSGTYTVSASFSLQGNIPHVVTKTVTALKKRYKIVKGTGVRKLNSAILNTGLINSADPRRLYFTDTGIREEFLASNNGTHSFYYLPREYIQMIADVVLSYPYYTDSSELRYGLATPEIEYLDIY